jgi:hypothetical protein
MLLVGDTSDFSFAGMRDTKLLIGFFWKIFSGPKVKERKLVISD